MDFLAFVPEKSCFCACVVNLDFMIAKRKMSLNVLSEKVDLTLSKLSILKTGKAKAIRCNTLEAICKSLDCQPGDILKYTSEEKSNKLIS
jgi:putative transcriptional regulator